MNITIRRTLLIAALLGTLTSQAFGLKTEKPEVISLLFYADYCGSCKVLDPKVEVVKEALSTEPILFIKLDHSSDETTNQAALLMDAIGMNDVYEAEKKSSGFMLVVDANTKEVIAKITRDMSESEIEAKIAESIRVS